MCWHTGKPRTWDLGAGLWAAGDFVSPSEEGRHFEAALLSGAEAAECALAGALLGRASAEAALAVSRREQR